jgi:FtsZ-binding cell division protein ZapB
MVDPEGAWLDSTVRDRAQGDRVVGGHAVRDAESPAASTEPGPGLEDELSLLETRVAEAADLVRGLREERDGLARERETLLRECGELRRECETLHREGETLRREREDTATRLAQIIARVDALRGDP